MALLAGAAMTCDHASRCAACTETEQRIAREWQDSILRHEKKRDEEARMRDALERRVEAAESVLADIAEGDCAYGDDCPTFGSRHGTCTRCVAHKALAPRTTSASTSDSDRIASENYTDSPQVKP